MELQLRGELTHVLDKVVYEKTNFTKREFIIKTDDAEYPQDIKFEVHGEKRADDLERYNKIGNKVSVKFNLRGKLFTNKDGVEVAYPSLVAWRIDRVETPQDGVQEEEEYDGLPF